MDCRVNPGNDDRKGVLEQAENNRSEEDKSGAHGGEVKRLDEDHRVASLCFTRRILTHKRRFQNMNFVTRCKTSN
jgi:hypothetical protein